MSTYSAEFKAQIVKKMMPPDTDNHSVAQISRESGSHTLLGMTPKQYEQQLLNKDVTYLGV